MLFKLIKKMFPSATVKPAGDGYFVGYPKPTEFTAKIQNEKQVELLNRILDNAGVTK